METSILEIATKVSTPLALAGITTGILYLLYRLLLKSGLLSQVGTTHSFRIINRVVTFLFILALVATILGISGYIAVLIIQPVRQSNISGDELSVLPPNNLITYSNSKKYEIVFVIDKTASMQPFIHKASSAIRDINNKIIEKKFDLKIGVVAFGDRTDIHGWQGSHVVDRAAQLSSPYEAADKMRKIQELTDLFNDDFPESVFDGIYEALANTNWTPESNRAIFLIDDAPSHPLGHPKNPDNHSIESLVQLAAAKRIRINTICICSTDKVANKQFKLLNETAQEQFNALSLGVNPALSGRYYQLGTYNWNKYQELISNTVLEWISIISRQPQ